MTNLPGMSTTAPTTTLRHESIPSGALGCVGTVVWNEATRSAVVIDATDDPAPFLDLVRERGLVLKAVLLTHAHFDHAAGTDRVARETGLAPRLHRDDWGLYAALPQWGARFGLELAAPSVAPQDLADGEVLEIEDGFRLTVLHTPGHTPGQVAFHIAELGLVVVGDTLFNESVGRTDFPGGSMEQLQRSIRTRLYALPDETVVVPGHGPETTIGHEKRFNPYVRA